MSAYQTEVLVIGGGLAGIATVLELLDHNKKVILLERGPKEELGGLAKLSFGGISLVGSPQQRRSGIQDNPELALRDWLAYAEFGPQDTFPKKWAEIYVNESANQVGDWLSKHSVKFFPLVHWVEKGLFRPGNSVPRFHMVWGTGHGLVLSLLRHLEGHKCSENLTLLFEHQVETLMTAQGRVVGACGVAKGEGFEVQADVVVVASGGICGNLEKVRKHWFGPWGTPPEVILNGAHPRADGKLHDACQKVGANITHLDKMWNYASGVHHPNPKFPLHGLSLISPKSALWMNDQGKRIGPVPLVGGFDSRFLVERVCEQKVKYSWQILNYKIAKKELAVSGAEYNPAIRDKKFFAFLKDVLLGNKALVDHLIHDCPDFVVGDSIEDLSQKMNELTGENDIQAPFLKKEIEAYDAMIDRGSKYFNDDQLRRIASSRSYRGDRARTCKFQKIVDHKALPLIAIREFVLSRKSMGGMQTDLQSRILTNSSDGTLAPIEGLYAVGEAAGFGGGGIHGLRALEGTFLGSCILTGRKAGQSIAGIKP